MVVSHILVGDGPTNTETCKDDMGQGSSTPEIDM